MKITRFAITVIIVPAILMLSVIFTASPAEKKDAAKLGHDYRTFHTDGKIEYGKIGDSYTAELVV